MDEGLTQKALRIATQMHDGQLRKETPIPYITHPVAVALNLAKHGFAENVIAAALVHDVLEDTNMTRALLEKELGVEVVTIVMSLSEDKSLPWEERKRNYIETIRSSDANVKAVSIADKIHNAESMLIAYSIQGENLWQMFARGKQQQQWFMNELLAMFEETWDHPLNSEYRKLVEAICRL